MAAQRLPQIIGSVRAYRHWHAPSERYTGGDSLVTMIEAGWSVGEIARIEEHWLSPTRRVRVIHFELKRQGDTQFMSVISNPYVENLVTAFGIHAIPIARLVTIHTRKRTYSPVRQTTPQPAAVGL